METVQGGVPPYGVKEALVVNGKWSIFLMHICIVQRIDLDFRSMRYIKIDIISILILSNLI